MARQKLWASQISNLKSTLLVLACVFDYVQSCVQEHNISPTSLGRQGIKLQFNVLGDTSELSRLRSYTQLWMPDVASETTEVNFFFGLGSEDPRIATEFKANNIVYVPGVTPADRFISVVNHVAMLSSCDIDWYVFVDDDTLLFPGYLKSVLQKHDPDQLIYIGNGSEEKIQISLHGWFAQGGGGIIVSRELLHKITYYFPTCLANVSAIHGDEKFRDCVTAVGAPLLADPGLHQMDIRGDVSGFMEGYVAMNRPLLSLHHLGVNDLHLMPDRPNKVAAQAMFRAYSAMPGVFMNRYVLRLHESGVTIILTVGYSIQIIQRVLSYEELSLTEATMSQWRLPTWDHVEFRGYHFDTRPPESSKHTYYFQDYYRMLKLQIYGDQNHNTVIVMCGTCREKAPICLKHTDTTQSRTVLKLHVSKCAF